MYKQIIEVKKGTNGAWTANLQGNLSLSAAGPTEEKAKEKLMMVFANAGMSSTLSEYRVHDVTEEQ